MPTTKQFVEDWGQRLEGLHSEELDWIRDHLRMLAAPSGMRPGEGYDVEALLKLFGDLLTLQESALGMFVEPIKDLPELSEVEAADRDLKNFIRQRCYVSKDTVSYLEPLRQLLQIYETPLAIFSANYDTAIEVFCMTNDIEFNNGFRGWWSPDTFQDERAEVNLYKLHGSVTWYRTEEGRIVEVPVLRGPRAGLLQASPWKEIGEGELDLYWGSHAETLMIYPFDPTKTVPLPTLDLLPMLRETLNQADVVVVVGYSFRDPDIREIFWDAARRRNGLIFVLVGPSSYQVYRRELAEIRPGVPSPLAGRVTCLPYPFEKVFPCLYDHHLKQLKWGWDRYWDNERGEVRGGQEAVRPDQWLYPADEFAQAGHSDNVLKVLDRCDIEEWEAHKALGIVSRAYGAAAIARAPEERELGEWLGAAWRKLTSTIQVVLRGDEVSLSFLPPSGKAKSPRHEIVRQLEEEAGAIGHLISLLRGKNVPPQVRELSNSLEGSARYLRERWPWHEGDFRPVSSLRNEWVVHLGEELQNSLDDLGTLDEYGDPTHDKEDDSSPLAVALTRIEQDLFLNHIGSHWGPLGGEEE